MTGKELATIQAQPTPMVPYSDVERMAVALANSKLFGIKTPEQAIALMLLAQAEGLHPATAARDYHIIQGSAAKTADAMLASFQAAGGVIEWEELSDSRACATFMHPRACPKPVRIDWDMARASRAGLSRKDNWCKYPRAMLRARVVSEGMKCAYPAALSGLYTPEEVGDFEPHEQARSATTTQPTPESTQERPAAPVVTLEDQAPRELTFSVRKVQEYPDRGFSIIMCDGQQLVYVDGQALIPTGSTVVATVTQMPPKDGWTRYKAISWRDTTAELGPPIQ